MKRIYIMIAALFLLSAMSCKREFLEATPQGSLGEEVLSTADGVRALLIGAYGTLSGQNLGASQPWFGSPDNWIFGSIAGGDAHKGSDAGDQAPINPVARWSISSDNPTVNDKWKVIYAGIAATNSVLRILDNVEDMDEKERDNIEAQARFLRGHYYFELKKMFNMVPWIDENTEEIKQKNDVDIWPNIEADFQFAFDNLPETQADAGRANKWAAGTYLAKTYLYEKKYPEARDLFDQVISQGKTPTGVKYGLFDEFEKNFRPEFELQSPEAVFVVEMAAEVGTGEAWKGSIGQTLNYPYDSPFGCCGFYQPTLDLANSYRTDANGLPYLDDYNDHGLKDDLGIGSKESFTPDADPVDPRLDWTVGRRGIPLLDWGNHPGADWIRDQSFSGPYANKKNIWWHSTEQFHDNNYWAPVTAINAFIIRFSDVLLMAAEAHAEADGGNLTPAMDLVNQVRRRAANPDGFVYQYIDNTDPSQGFSTTPAANYKISEYTSFPDKEYALKAIRFERKLELAMEGQRFFDISRWGIADQVMNAFYSFEGARIVDIKGAHFTKGRNEFYPIPLNQIDVTYLNGEQTLKQNPGYPD